MSKAVTKEQLADCLERIGDYFVQTNEDFTGATSVAGGAKGMVPAPAAGNQYKYLRGDGTWNVPTNTKYSNFVGSGSGAKAGLVPAPSKTAGSTKYLCENGTWAEPAGGGGGGGQGGNFFEVDLYGGLMPSEAPVYSDDFELDGNGDIMPK